MEYRSLFLEDIIGDNAIFESNTEKDDSVYTIKISDASELIAGYYYDVYIHHNGRYKLCINDNEILYADLEINFKITDEKISDIRSMYRDLKLRSQFFSNMYHAEMNKNVQQWYEFLENIKSIMHGEKCRYEKMIKDNFMYNIAEIVHDSISVSLIRDDYAEEYFYIPMMNVLLQLKNINRKRASIIMHALDRKKFMVYNKECDTFFKMIDFNILNENNSNSNWYTYYYLYSDMLQKNIESYHYNHNEYFKNKYNQDDIYREAASYYINNFKLDLFLYDNL